MNLKIVNVNKFDTIRALVDTHYLNTCKWIGTFFSIAGAIATSGGFDPINILAFNLGAVFWLLASIRMKDSALIAVNAGLLGIYALGVIFRLI
jgi:hypothetical protein